VANIESPKGPGKSIIFRFIFLSIYDVVDPAAVQSRRRFVADRLLGLRFEFR
jgi:hypothetical protein